MRGSPATPGAVTPRLADYYHWEEPGRGISVYLHGAAADRLHAAGFEAAAQGGREAGGILLGHTGDQRGATSVFIDDFVAVPCRYRGGPQFDLSGDDTLHLESALLQAAFAGCDSPSAPSIIGYYRSHVRDGLYMSAVDLELAGSYFQSPASVFLIIKAVPSTKACTAGFFFWEDGRIQSEFSPLEVALGGHFSPPVSVPPSATVGIPELPAEIADDLQDDLPADLTELFDAPSSPPPALLPPSDAAVLHPPPRAWRGRLLRAATILMATAALIISLVAYLGGPKPPREEAAVARPAPPALGLQVDRNPPDLLVTWNRYAPDIVAARRGTLLIQDGKADRTVNLDATQLATGSYLYTAAGDEIELRLEVYGPDDGSVAQSVRVRIAASHR